MRYKIETERENLFDVNMVIAMRVRIAGVVLFEDLEKAFYKAVASYEILNSKVVIEENLIARRDSFSYASPGW